MGAMIDFFDGIDTQLLLFLNGANNAFFDEFFWLVTGKFAWIPMICVLLYSTFRKDWKMGAVVILGVALTIALCDQVSSGIIKDAVCRLRPTRDPEIGGIVHIVNGYRGGQYGFVSSHAANSFGVAVFLAMLFRRRAFTWTIMLWAAVLSYSRIYLGVHYPGDIICGGLLGAALGAAVYCIYVKAAKLRFLSSLKVPDGRDARWLVYATVGNMVLLLAVATIIYVVK